MEENKNKMIRAPQQYQYARERYYNELWCIIPYHLQRNNTRNIAMVHTYTRKRGQKEGQKRKEIEKKGKSKKRKKSEAKFNMLSGR